MYMTFMNGLDDFKNATPFFICLSSFCLAQSLAKLTGNFHNLSISDSVNEVATSSVAPGDSVSGQQYTDAGCQTDLIGEVSNAEKLERDWKMLGELKA